MEMKRILLPLAMVAAALALALAVMMMEGSQQIPVQVRVAPYSRVEVTSK